MEAGIEGGGGEAVESVGARGDGALLTRQALRVESGRERGVTPSAGERAEAATASGRTGGGGQGGRVTLGGGEEVLLDLSPPPASQKARYIVCKPVPFAW